MERSTARSAGALVLSCFAFLYCELQSWGAARAQTPQPAKSAATTRAALAEIPKSVFVIPANPREGRNPFFPKSSAILPAPTPQPGPAPKTLPVASMFELNGLTPAGHRPTAMVNGHTFEEGESAEVKVPGGDKVLIKLVEIKKESAIIEAQGQRIELKLKYGLGY